MVMLLAAADKFSRAILLPLGRILLANGVMAVLLWFLGPMVSDMASVVRLLILVVAGGVTYFATAALFGAIPSIFCAVANGCWRFLGVDP